MAKESKSKYLVNKFPVRKHVPANLQPKSLIITEVRRDGGPLVIKEGDVVELTDWEYRRLYKHESGPILPEGLLTPVPKNPQPASQKPDGNAENQNKAKAGEKRK